MSVLHTIEEHIDVWADRICISYENDACTYSALLKNVRKASQLLIDAGVARNSRVYLSGVNSIDLVSIFIALLDSGTDVVLVDPKSTGIEIKNMLEAVPANYMLLQKDALPVNENVIKEICVHTVPYNIVSNNSHYLKNTNGPFITFFTTGSTGQPKAFSFSEEKLIKQVTNLSEHLQLNMDDRVLCPVSFTHSHGVMMSLPFLLLGASVHYLHPKNCSAQQLAKYIALNEISVFTGVPLQYNRILEEAEGSGTFSTLRYAFCGSAPMSEYLAVNFHKKFGVRINQAYGISEIGPICVNLYTDGNNNYQSAGKVIRNIEYRVVDDKDKEVEKGEEGELIVRSEFMTDGYVNAENSKLFRNGWMCTQDIVREDEFGNIFILGRKSGFINVAGYKVYPVEVERVLLSMKGIKDAMVVGQEDDQRTQIVNAYVTTFYPISESEIRAHCAQNLSSYKIPYKIEVVDDLPTNSIGKVIARRVGKK